MKKTWPGNYAVYEVLVVNASPLIFLGNAGRLELLRSAGERIVVPQQVYDEVANGIHADSAARALTDANWVERAVASDIPTSVVEWDIGAGESAVVALAMNVPGSTAVIDDLFGRKCALAHRINVVGCVGLVIAAHRRGDVADPKSLLHELRSAGMWLSDSVLERALVLAKLPG